MKYVISEDVIISKKQDDKLFIVAVNEDDNNFYSLDKISAQALELLNEPLEASYLTDVLFQKNKHIDKEKIRKFVKIFINEMIKLDFIKRC